MNREAIYSALWDRLLTIPGFVTQSRRLKHWADLDRSAQPALFLAQGSEEAECVSAQPTRWRLNADVYLYVRTDGDAAPGPILNPLLDAVCDTINAVHPTTGLTMLPVAGVSACRVEGAIETDEGCLGDQAVAIVPVVILTT